MLKKDVRKTYLQRRLELSVEEVEDKSIKIAKRFLHWLPKSVFTVHIYLPIQHKREIDTWPIVQELWKRDINIVVPIMNITDGTLSSWVLTPQTQLQKNIWGVSEPLSSNFVDFRAIDLVVLPLLAFDLQGFRVGYGKGYYDKFLNQFDHQPIKVGLSFFEAIGKISNVHEADIAMDHCIIPDRIISF